MNDYLVLFMADLWQCRKPAMKRSYFLSNFLFDLLIQLLTLLLYSLKRLRIRFGKNEREQKTSQGDDGSKTHRSWQANVTEQNRKDERANECANFANSSRNAVSRCTYLHRKNLGRIHKRRHIRTKLGKEVAQAICQQERYRDSCQYWEEEQDAVGECHHRKTE